MAAEAPITAKNGEYSGLSELILARFQDNAATNKNIFLLIPLSVLGRLRHSRGEETSLLTEAPEW